MPTELDNRDKLIAKVVDMYRQFNIGYDPAISVLMNCGLSAAQADAKLLGYVVPPGATTDNQ